MPDTFGNMVECSECKEIMFVAFVCLRKLYMTKVLCGSVVSVN